MPSTKVEVLMNGEPVVGATVLIGEIGGLEKTTDEGGKVSLPNIETSYAGYTEALITMGGVDLSARITIKYGETTTIELGNLGEQE